MQAGPARRFSASFLRCAAASSACLLHGASERAGGAEPDPNPTTTHRHRHDRRRSSVVKLPRRESGRPPSPLRAGSEIESQPRIYKTMEQWSFDRVVVVPVGGRAAYRGQRARGRGRSLAASDRTSPSPVRAPPSLDLPTAPACVHAARSLRSLLFQKWTSTSSRPPGGIPGPDSLFQQPSSNASRRRLAWESTLHAVWFCTCVVLTADEWPIA